MNVDKTNSSFV